MPAATKCFTGKFSPSQHVAKAATHGCNYLLVVNIGMEPMAGYRLADWDKGFGDFEIRPDLSTLRVVPWQTATALVLCDLDHSEGRPVQESPRAVLKRQIRGSRKG